MRYFAIVLAVTLVATAVEAGQNWNNKIAVHVKSHPTSCAEGYPSFLDCTSIQTTWAGCGDADVMPVFYELIEFTSVEFGLSWWFDPTLSMVWTRCKGDAAAGTITHSGDGTVITWAACQVAYSVVPGYGWLTVSGPEIVSPDLNPVTRRCGVIDCQVSPGPYFDWSLGWYSAGICGPVGDDPCAPADAVEPSTWGAIKALLR
jgi:hypothetical protein